MFWGCGWTIGVGDHAKPAEIETSAGTIYPKPPRDVADVFHCCGLLDSGLTNGVTYQRVLRAYRLADWRTGQLVVRQALLGPTLYPTGNRNTLVHCHAHNPTALVPRETRKRNTPLARPFQVILQAWEVSINSQLVSLVTTTPESRPPLSEALQLAMLSNYRPSTRSICHR